MQILVLKYFCVYIYTNLNKNYAFWQIFSVSRSILGMPTFRESCRPLHQSEEQSDTVRLLLALMKWPTRFMKRWHSKNGSGHGENPRNANIIFI
ncbi:hypothetical protein ALC56_06168 [Trachymyrmex septentrionalis]|uniref:Uncharacterized protein n=1 Tax=Trachymyrmex septentrionalis TaxID=34720 RepID=A0A195FH11_9HYME|nr:hypothetical protein ALC56_06168 [Trachymyrmex septentrionalis]